MRRMKTKKWLTVLLAVVAIAGFMSCGDDDEETKNEQQTTIPEDDKATPGKAERSPEELIVGTWELVAKHEYVEDGKASLVVVDDSVRYTFFSGGVFCAIDCLYGGDGLEGTYSISNNSIEINPLDNDYWYLKNPKLIKITEDSLNFSTDEYVYKGHRIVDVDINMTETNKKALLGNWIITKNEGDYYPDENTTEQLSIDVNGNFIHSFTGGQWNDEYQGKVYVAEDRVYFTEGTGKDPIGGIYIVEKLTDTSFILANCQDERVYANKE